LEFRSVGFCEERKTEELGHKWLTVYDIGQLIFVIVMVKTDSIIVYHYSCFAAV